MRTAGPMKRLILVLCLSSAGNSAGASYGANRERVYAVSGRLILPQHGEQTFRSTVRLLEMTPPADDARSAPAGARMVRMVVEDALFFDAHGRNHMLPPKLDMQRQPLYFWQGRDGGVLSVAHHASEESQVVGAKKALVAAHQLPFELTHVARQWEVTETDAVGLSSCVYKVGRSRRLLLPVRRRLMEKRQVYAESSAVPAAFRYEANSTVILDERGFPISIQQRALFRPRHINEMLVGSTGNMQGSKRLAELDGFDLLPNEPNEVYAFSAGRLEKVG